MQVGYLWKSSQWLSIYHHFNTETVKLNEGDLCYVKHLQLNVNKQAIYVLGHEIIDYHHINIETANLNN